MQQTVLEMVREARADGRTIFFSSHILSEVQAVCDRVGIIREGRLVATERVEDMMTQQFKRIRLQFENMPPVGVFSQDGATEVERNEQGVLLEVHENLPQVMEKVASFGIVDIETRSVSLEEIFLAYYGKGNGGNHA